MREELLIKFLLRETSAEEDILVNEWIAADPANKKQFAQIEQIWNSSKILASKSTVGEDEAWQRFKAKASAPPAKEAQMRSLTDRYSWLKIAAVLLLVAGASLWYLLNRESVTTLTAGAEVLVQTLPDGSEITMNKNTLISYKGNLDGDQRNVSLKKGEAFFKVVPNPAKPFIIDADDVTVQVVGTSFNVKHTRDLTEVIVETGIVRISVGDQEMEALPGDKVSIINHKLDKKTNPDQLYMYYKSKMFVVDNTPLSRIVEVLNDVYDAHISVESTEVGRLTLTTSFKEGTLDQILQIISETLNLKVVRNGQYIILKK